MLERIWCCPSCGWENIGHVGTCTGCQIGWDMYGLSTQAGGERMTKREHQKMLDFLSVEPLTPILLKARSTPALRRALRSYFARKTRAEQKMVTYLRRVRREAGTC